MKMIYRWAKFFEFICAAFLLFSALNACASDVQGTITDPLGAVIANATVQLVAHNETIATAITDSAGKYHLQSGKSGQFHLHIEASTFAAVDTPPFYLSGGKETITRDAFLQLRNVSEAIVVTATGVPISEAQVGATVDVLTPADYLNDSHVLEPLPTVPGLQITQTGQRGGGTSLFIRGGESDANKVLVDGVPINDIGGYVEFADLLADGVENIEILRGPNSVLYGSDALAGVVSMTTRQGTTPLPLLEYSADGGNFGTYHQEGRVSGMWRRFDYFADLARFDTSNSLPNNRYHDQTYTGNFGWSPSTSSSLRLTVRRFAAGDGSPNATDFYGLSDNAQETDHNTFVSATYQNQTTSKWHNLLRYGASRLDGHYDKPFAVGYFDTNIDSYVGLPVTIRGANGYSASGQALLSFANCCPSLSTSTANRDFVYAQSDYALNAYANFLFGYRYEAERGTSVFSAPGFTSDSPIDRRNMSFIMETHGNFRNRFFYSAGGSIEKNAVFGVEATPRLSLAYYPFLSNSGLFRATKLSFNFGKGIKEPSIFDQTDSLFNLLRTSGNTQLISKYDIQPIAAARSRSYDLGVNQSLGDAVKINLTLFHNQFTNEVEFVSSSALPALGVPPAVAAASGYGATINSDDYRAEGVESEIQYRVSNSVTVRSGYTYLDARVEHSYANNLLCLPDPFCTNPSIPNVPIGPFSPLVGARPFRRAPHTGFAAVTYNHSRFTALFQGVFVSRRDDSTFLLFSDASFGNSLLLPNRNLAKGYQKLDLSGSIRLTNYVTSYVAMENLLSQRYEEAFGYPALPFSVRAGLKFTFGGESWHK